MRKTYLIAAVWLSLLLLAACSDGAGSGSGGKLADTGLSAAPAEDSVIRVPGSTGQPQSSSQPYLGRVYKVVVDPGHGGEDPGQSPSADGWRRISI